MAEKKKANKWNLAELQDSLVKDTEQKIEQGFKEIAEQSSEAAVAQQQTQQQALEPVRDITAPAGRTDGAVAAVTYQEPMQNINIPIPTSQHIRLKIISAQSRQTMKDMVVQAIGLWLDVQEGKKTVKSPEL